MASTHRASRHAFAPMAPMPTEPGICRWCHGKLRALMPDMPADYCERGCAGPDSAPYLGHCGECGRQFHTGKRVVTGSLCYGCEEIDRAVVARVRATVPDRRSAYSFKRIGRGRFID